MKILSIGSKIFDDAVKYTKVEKEIQITRITNISPFTISFNNFDNDILINNNYFENQYIADVITMEINGGRCLKDEKVDSILVDLLDARISYEEIELEDGTKYRISNTNYVDNCIEDIIKTINNGKKMTKRKTINPLLLTDNELRMEIKKFVKFLDYINTCNNIILVDFKIPIEFVSKDNEVSLFKNVCDRTRFNYFFSKCIKIFNEEGIYDFITAPNIVYGDEQIQKLSLFSFTKEMYEFYIKTIQNFTMQKKNLEDYYRISRQRITKIILERLFFRCVEQNYTKENIIVIGDENILTTDILKNIDIEINNFIIYEKNMIRKKFEEKIKKYINNSKSIILIPEVIDQRLITIIEELKSEFDFNYMCFQHNFIHLKNFIGEYLDISNNYIKSERENEVIINGIANSININNSSNLIVEVRNVNNIVIKDDVKTVFKNKKLKIVCNDFSYIIIEEKCIFGNNCKIKAENKGNIYIGKDCEFSSETIIKDNLGKDGIYIGEHVWTGVRTFLLSGTKIGDGSIVEAGSVVFDKFYNNCKIAGSPARYIEVNIAWHNLIEQDDFLKIPEKYRRSTEQDGI